MEEKLLIDRKVLLVLISIGILLIVLGSLLTSYSRSGVLTEIGVIFGFITWLITLLDIIRNPVKNKTIWILLMVIFSALTVLFYLSTREKRLSKQEKKE